MFIASHIYLLICNYLYWYSFISLYGFELMSSAFSFEPKVQHLIFLVSQFLSGNVFFVLWSWSTILLTIEFLFDIFFFLLVLEHTIPMPYIMWGLKASVVSENSISRWPWWGPLVFDELPFSNYFLFAFWQYDCCQGSQHGWEKEFWDTVHLRSREGNGTPLQYSCLENPMDGGAW